MEIVFAAGTVIASVVGVGVALGTMIHRMRSDFDRRIDGLDQRIDRLERRIDGLDQRIDRLERRMDGLERRIDALEQRMDVLEQRMDALDHRMDGLEARMRALDASQNRVVGLLEGLGLTGQLAAERKPAS